MGIGNTISGSFNLIGGLLRASNATATMGGAGFFYQRGGIFQVSNLFSASGPLSTFSPDSGCFLSGGQLVAQNIRLDSGMIFHHTGGSVVNPGIITLASGIWLANTNQTRVGSLLLALPQDSSSGSNSTLSLSAGSCMFRFAASASITWSNQETLTIENWNGSVAGGGLSQVTFGNNASALTSQQLNQIRFHDPGGSSGMYPATILSSGEIVPDRFLGSRRQSGNLVLEWPPGWTLQSATNVPGPYQDVSSATSPYTNSFGGGRLFFRLRH